MKILTKTFLIVFSIILFSCSNDDEMTTEETCVPEEVICPQSIIDDRDGHTYPVVKIGCQCWMAKNLNYAETGSCYEDSLELCEIYGRLYTWEEAMNGTPHDNLAKIQGICPKGWHLPSSWEFRELIEYSGGYETGGRQLKKDTCWYISELYELEDIRPNGFNATPSNGSGEFIFYTEFLSATRVDDSEKAWLLKIETRTHEADFDTKIVIRPTSPKTMSCRCIMD